MTDSTSGFPRGPLTRSAALEITERHNESPKNILCKTRVKDRHFIFSINEKGDYWILDMYTYIASAYFFRNYISKDQDIASQH